jgi:hypothetical protein
VLETPGEHDPVAQRSRCRAVGAGLFAVQGVQEREQLAERRPRAALELAPGEGDVPRRAEVAGRERLDQALEPLSPRPEADDDQPGVGYLPQDERPGGGQELDALGDDELADEGDVAVVDEVESRERAAGGGLVAGEGRPGRRRAAALGTGAAVAQAGRDRGERGGRLLAAPRPELVDVDAGRTEPRALRERGIAHRRPQALGGVPGADEHGPGAGEPLPGRRQEALRVGLDRVLQRTAVDLHRVGHVAAERAREHERPHHEVVGQGDVGPGARRDVPDGGHVGRDVGGDLLVGEVGERARLDAVVAVGDVHREQAADVRAPGRHLHGLAQDLDPRLTPLPGPDRVDEVQRLRPPVLGEQVDDVSAAAQGGGQARVVDVGPRAMQEVPVEHQDAHPRQPRCRIDPPARRARRDARTRAVSLASWPIMAGRQLYRLRTPSTGREILLEAEPGKIYRDRDTGEELEVVGMVVPVAPSPSRLPWAVENLRFCNWCDQLAQRDLNDCPTCGRRMAPLAAS